MTRRASVAVVAVGALATLGLGACGSGGGTHAAGATSSVPGAVTPARTTLPAAAASLPSTTSGTAKCPGLAQAETALGHSYGGPAQTPVGSIGIVCEYTGSSAVTNAGVTIFAHLPASVFAGQVSNAGRAPGMQRVSGVGDGAYGLSAGGRTIVNAWSNGSHTVVAAQSAGTLSQTEALAKIALSDN